MRFHNIFYLDLLSTGERDLLIIGDLDLLREIGDLDLTGNGDLPLLAW